MFFVQLIQVKAKDTRTPKKLIFDQLVLVNMIICVTYEAHRVARVIKTYTKGFH